MSLNRETIERVQHLGQGLVVLTLIMLATSGWWRSSAALRESPTLHFSSPKPPLVTATCAECHPAQVDSLASAPHSITLHAGTSPEIQQQFDGLAFRDLTAAREVDRFVVENQQLWRKNADFPDPLPIDWVFGSGRHARTPVTLRRTASGQTELLQHRLSWYPGVGLDLTLGSSGDSPQGTGWHGLGTRLNAVETAECFGCHVTWLPETEDRRDLMRPDITRPDFTRMMRGVQCARCHLQSADHVAAMQLGSTATQMERWSELSALDSIRRCGECHRRDDHFTPRELRADNQLLVRFAPVGLSQSRCFLAQDPGTAHESTGQRLDCLTCHNPHRAAESRAEYYVERCLTCHNSHSASSVHCSAPNTTQQCLECHMPKVEVQPHLRFTDHWIRKRKA